MDDARVGLCKLHTRCTVFCSQQMHVAVCQNHLNLVGVVYCSVLYHYIHKHHRPGIGCRAGGRRGTRPEAKTLSGSGSESLTLVTRQIPTLLCCIFGLCACVLVSVVYKEEWG